VLHAKLLNNDCRDGTQDAADFSASSNASFLPCRCGLNRPGIATAASHLSTGRRAQGYEMVASSSMLIAEEIGVASHIQLLIRLH